jgi:GNAT superfamily N-acetyltransferase
MFIDELLLTLIRLKYPTYPDPEHEIQDKNLAPDFKVSPGAFSNYKNGKRKPDPAQAERMAEAWTMSLQDVQWDELKSRLSQSEVEVSSPHEVKEKFKDLLAGSLTRDALSPGNDTTLHVSTLNYGVFSGGADRLFEKIFYRYIGQLGYKTEIETRKDFKLDRQFRSGEIHVALCYFQHVSRTEARFTPTPLRINLAAVCHARHKSRITEVAGAVANVNPDRTAIHPVVVSNEAGYLYCRNTLNYRDDNDRKSWTVVKEYDLDKLRDLLSESDEKDGIRTIIIDEYSALLLLKEMGPEGLLASPLTSNQTARHSEYRRELPQYFMSFATPNRNPFSDFFTRTFSMFLRAEQESTARELVNAFWKLEQQVLEAIKFQGYWSGDSYDGRALSPVEARIQARQHAMYTFGLDEFSIASPESHSEDWRQIIRRVRDIVRAETVSSRIDQAKKFIGDVLGGDNPFGQLYLPQQMKNLRDYFDPELNISDYRGRYSDEILSMITAKLAGEVEEEEIEIVPITPESAKWNDATDENVRGVRSLLSRLADMYSLLPSVDGNSVTQRILKESSDKGRMLRYTQILLAVAKTKEAIQYAGIICIRENPGCLPTDSEEYNENPSEESRNHLEKTCELRYLIVSERYRHQNVSRLLLGSALNWCRDQRSDTGPRYKYAWLAILPQLEEAIARVLQMRFRGADERLYHGAFPKDRFVFERDLRGL